MNRKERRKEIRNRHKLLKQAILKRDIACRKLAETVEHCESYECENCGNVITLMRTYDGNGHVIFSKKYDQLCDSCKEKAEEVKEELECDIQ